MQTVSEKNNMFYLSGHIFNKNNKLYWEENGKKIKINKKNWKKYIEDFGWNSLELGWNRRFTKLLNVSKFNNSYCLKDCGEDGDCLFLCVAHAFNNTKTIDNHIYEEEIRTKSSEGITDQNFKSILESYILEKNIGEFEGMWDPYTIENKEDLRKELIKSGNNFWGDHILMQLLSLKLEINFVILSDNLTINVINNELKYPKTMFIFYIDNLHFQLVGYFNGRFIENIFFNDNIPICFRRLMKKYIN